MPRPTGEKYVIGLLLFIIAADIALLIVTSPLITNGSLHIGDITLVAGFSSAEKLVSLGLLTLVNASGLFLLITTRPSGWIVSMSAILFFALVNIVATIDFIKYKTYFAASMFSILSLAGLVGIICLFRTITRHRFRINNLSYLLVLIFTAALFIFIYR